MVGQGLHTLLAEGFRVFHDFSRRRLQHRPHRHRPDGRCSPSKPRQGRAAPWKAELEVAVRRPATLPGWTRNQTHHPGRGSGQVAAHLALSGDRQRNPGGAVLAVPGWYHQTRNPGTRAYNGKSPELSRQRRRCCSERIRAIAFKVEQRTQWPPPPTRPTRERNNEPVNQGTLAVRTPPRPAVFPSCRTRAACWARGCRHLRTFVLLVLAVLGAVSPRLAAAAPAVEEPRVPHPPLLRPGFLLGPRPARRHPLGAGHARGAGPLPGRVPGRQAPRLPTYRARLLSCSGKNTRAPGSTASSSPTTTPWNWWPATGQAVSRGGRLRHQRSRLHPGRRGRPVQHHRKPGAHGHAHRGPAPESDTRKIFVLVDDT